MDEHMMLAEIAALKNEIETMKGIIRRLTEQTHPTCETCKVYHEYKKGCPLEWSGRNPKVDYCSNHNPMEDKTNV